MFVNEELNNSKSNYNNMNFPLYFSPYIHKKKEHRKSIHRAKENPGRKRIKFKK